MRHHPNRIARRIQRVCEQIEFRLVKGLVRLSGFVVTIVGVVVGILHGGTSDRKSVVLPAHLPGGLLFRTIV